MCFVTEPISQNVFKQLGCRSDHDIMYLNFEHVRVPGIMYLVVSAMSSEVRGSLKLPNIDLAPDTAPNSVET